MAEHLACPVQHDTREYCVLVPDEMIDRMVRRGLVACPVCRAEYPVVDGVVRFGRPPQTTSGATIPDAAVVQALLDLSGAGGYVVLVGTASQLARPLSERQPGVHMVTVNASRTYQKVPASHLEAASGIPLRDGMARGVVVGAEVAKSGWATEGARVLQRGRRFVALSDVELPEGIARLAAGDGVVVGEKRGSD